MDDKVKEILNSHKEMTKNVCEALRQANVPEPLIASYTFNTPNIDKMLPEDVLRLFKDFKKIIILYLNKMGFSQREISRRIGGNLVLVNQTIREKEKLEMEKNI